MEKKTTKKKKSKRLKKRIGIIAVGGLSLVLTICLSVGATLAWFAGDTWASKSMYMGGPVYIEMAGEGNNGLGSTPGDGDATWKGGEGNLDIHASAARDTGTYQYDNDDGTDTIPAINPEDVLLPGQRVEIYSQARVFSTGYTNTVADNPDWNQTSGGTTTNTSNGVDGNISYYDGTGRVTTATTSVVRARFSIDVEFDPSVGFNNFTDEDYMAGYPKQSTNYARFYSTEGTSYGVDGTVATGDGATAKLAWEDALILDAYSLRQAVDADVTADSTLTKGQYIPVTTANGTRRDGLKANSDYVNPLDSTNGAANLQAIRAGNKKSIYKWKYCTKTVYDEAAEDTSTPGTATAGKKYMQMGAPFDGTGTDSPVKYYAVYILDETTGYIEESDAFYKARCSAYLQTYVEYYENSYGNVSARTIGGSIAQLDGDLNDSFKELVWKSSDSMITNDYKKTYTTGESTSVTAYPSWLYVDPKIGNDTNTDEISTSTGGWWYLVESNDTKITKTGTGANMVYSVYDVVTGTDTGSDGITGMEIETSTPSATMTSAATTTAGIGAFQRDTQPSGTDNVHDYTNDSGEILYAKLYEMIPNLETATKVGKNGNTDIIKVVSIPVPFVNGAFSLPGKSLTNIFANAKLTFKISFQALQAFFPYTEDIDGTDSDSPVQGLAKALNIKNAIPVFNEAFDY